VLCGKWESYPREFAKCRRCRKAKYCGKECQSTAWSEGHRFWCSAKDVDDDGPTEAVQLTAVQDGDISIAADDSMEVILPVGMTTGGAGLSRTERRERERHQRERAVAVMNNRQTGQFRGTVGPGGTGATGVFGHGRAEGSNTRDRDRLAPHAPVIPSPARTRGGDSRPRVAALHYPPQGTFTGFDGGPTDLGQRRRAETVTGAMGATHLHGGRDAPLHPLAHHHPHSRMQPQLSPGRSFVSGGTGQPQQRPEAGPSRRRRGGDDALRSPGDHDMVLG
jgi:hypothetical protein